MSRNYSDRDEEGRIMEICLKAQQDKDTPKAEPMVHHAEDEEFTLCELVQCDAQWMTELKCLMGQLTSRLVVTDTDILNVLRAPDCHLYALLLQGHIVGCATLCIFHSPTGRKASVEDVVVAQEQRGKHLGRVLVEYVLQQAAKRAPIEVQLTSNPKRVAANGLYLALGFVRKETNCYRLSISGK